METISFCGSALSQLAWLNNGIDMSAGKYIITDGEEKITAKDRTTVFLKYFEIVWTRSISLVNFKYS